MQQVNISNDRPVLVVCSGGGHWMQLLRLLPALDGQEVEFATVRPDYEDDVRPRRFYVIPDANRHTPFRAIYSFLCVLSLVLRRRPRAVVSTGAMPGLFALICARLVRARTIWIDSIANAEELSISGRLAGRYADLWLTQWAHLAQADGPEYRGSVL